MYLPDGVMSNTFYQPEKSVRDILEKIFRGRPDLRTDLQAVTSSGRIVTSWDMSLADLEERAIYYGTTCALW